MFVEMYLTERRRYLPKSIYT